MSPFLKVLWANDSWPQQQSLLPFCDLLWYVTTHPPGSYLPKSHLMWRLHMRSEWCHNTQQRKMLQRMMTCFHFFQVKVTFESIFLTYKVTSDIQSRLFWSTLAKKKGTFTLLFFHTQKTQRKQAAESRRNNRKRERIKRKPGERAPSSALGFYSIKSKGENPQTHRRQQVWQWRLKRKPPSMKHSLREQPTQKQIQSWKSQDNIFHRGTIKVRSDHDQWLRFFNFSACFLCAAAGGRTSSSGLFYFPAVIIKIFSCQIPKRKHSCK